MKTIYLLFVVLTDAQGYESMKAVSNIEHKDKLSCHVEKAQYKETENMSFFCGDSKLFFQQRTKVLLMVNEYDK